MKIIQTDKANRQEIISQAVKVLRSGGLIIYPTETVYGAGVDATNQGAVKKLTAYKSRPFGKPYSIAVADQKMAAKFVELNSTAKRLYRQFLPGPVTVISKGKHRVAPGVESETGTLGIRISSHPLVTEIINSLGQPITATSANEAYKKRPYQISDVISQLSEKKKQLIDLIIDDGALPRNEPSTVIDTSLDDQVVLRQGAIKLKGKNQILSRSAENTRNFGKELWQKYEKFRGTRAIIIALEGPMGAGKTQLVKGVARAMGITQPVTSPTFQLINAYGFSAINNQQLTINNLIHIDAWRIETDDELEDLGIKQTISDKSVIAIEWADRVADLIRRYNEEAVIVWVKIKYGKSETERLISWGNL